jgi:hypothetical protein
MATFEIGFSDLWTYEVNKPDDRLPLGRLSDSGGHVHGLLEIKVNGRAIVHLGYFGPDDVCFNEWVFELQGALAALRGSPQASYTYDEGEQGQPAFRFEREGDSGFISIVASELSDGRADPEWQRAGFPFADFERSVGRFLAQLQAHIERAAPQYGRRWWLQITEPAGQPRR